MNNDHSITIATLRAAVRQFVNERDWEQFHHAKNLSMAIAIESSELMEHFQWAEGGECSAIIEKDRVEIEHEIADIVVALLSLCNSYDIDLSSIVLRKLEIIKQKYPIEKAKGRKVKYNKL